MARISKILRHRKPELLLFAAALVVFAFVWGVDVLRPKPVEIYVPAVIMQTAPPIVNNPQPDYTIAPPTAAATAVPAPQTTTRRTPQPTAAPQPVRVNVNTAGVEELQALPGIGAVKAQAIADYRKKHGMFLSAEELLNVTGIGPATLEKMRPHLVF